MSADKPRPLSESAVLVKLFGDKFAAHRDNYQQALIDLLMWEVIRPVCDRMELDFITGMGHYFFAAGDTHYDSHVHPKYLAPIFAILDRIDPVTNTPIGLWLVDYRKGQEL